MSKQFLAASKAPAQELVPDVRPSVCPSVRLSVCHSLFSVITTLHENEIYMADTYGQKCGIEINPNPLDQFLQEGGIKNQTPPEIPCSRYN